MDKRVSIIIPVYNVQDYLEKCIESCVEQNYLDLEIIIINDGSTDKSLELLNELPKKGRTVKIIDKLNEGVTAARLEGLLLATGDFVLLLDGDDYLDTSTISGYINVVNRTNCDFVLGNFIIEKTYESVEKTFPSFTMLSADEFLKYCFENNYFYITGCLIRRSLLIHAVQRTPRDITYGEDNVIMINLIGMLKSVSYYGGFSLHYVQRDNSVTNARRKIDIEMRARACSIVLDYIVKKKLRSALGISFYIFVYSEIASFVKSGLTYSFLNMYLRWPILFKKEVRGVLGYKNVLLLIGVYIAPTLTVAMYSNIKR